MQKSFMPNNANSKTKITLGQYVLALFCFFTLIISLMLVFLSAEDSGIADFGFFVLVGSVAGLAWFNQKIHIEE